MLWLAPALVAGCTTPRLAEFERELAARPSATAVLQTHCREPIRAQLVAEAMPLPPDAVLAGATGYRHVRLTCAGVVFSDARNWYRRELLTAEMNRQLDGSDRPFGAVAAPLRFTRERLASRRGRVAPCPAGTVLSQRGLLRLPGGEPLALVIECYQPPAIALAAPTKSLRS
jgi:hypothetical protein